MFKKYWIVGLFVLGLLIFLYPHIAQQHTKRAQMNEVVKIKDEFKHVSEKEKEKKKEGVHSCNEAIFMNEDGINDPFTFSYDRDHYEQCEDAPRAGEKIGVLEIPKLKLNIPMFIGTTEAELTQGVGQVDGSSDRKSTRLNSSHVAIS